MMHVLPAEGWLRMTATFGEMPHKKFERKKSNNLLLMACGVIHKNNFLDFSDSVINSGIRVYGNPERPLTTIIM